MFTIVYAAVVESVTHKNTRTMLREALAVINYKGCCYTLDILSLTQIEQNMVVQDCPYSAGLQ